MIFEKMNVMDEIKRSVEDMGFTELTEIQKQAIPLLLEGKDIIGQSQTGTGKTAAFAIPLLQKIDPELKQPQAIILCPTRELAVQVANEFRKISKYVHGVKSVAVYGGEPINRQIMALKRGAQVIIGTPGRMMDHMRRRTIKVADINTIILDEADEMLKMGFREDIEIILNDIRDDRQTILFSATMPKTIIDITHQYQKNPELIKITTKRVTADTIKQEYCQVSERNKMEAISRILDVNKPKRCIVFCNKKRIVDEVADELQLKGYIAEKIHGDLKQELRMKVLDKFNRGNVDVLVATDVAARGLDIQEVDLVINFDVPENEDYYVHRIGRSGRAGKEGKSITLVTRHDRRRIKNIEYYTKKKIDINPIPTLDQVNDSNIGKFIDEVIDYVENENLRKYFHILNKVDKDKYSMDEIAAALIKMNLELHDQTDMNDINEDFTKYSRDRRQNDQRKGQRPNKKRKGEKGKTRIFINAGKKDGIKQNHILGAIIGECGVNGNCVGAIDLLEKFSFVDVDNEVAKKVVKKLKDKKIKGKKVNVEIANGK